MIKATIIPAMALFFVILASCDLFLNLKEDDDFDTLKEGYFYAQNLTNRSFYKVEGEKLWEGEKCVIWAEKGSGITRSAAQSIAHEYDDKIRRLIVDKFSKKDFTEYYEGVTYHFDDMLDYANWLVDGNDGKLTILLLDIQDGFEPKNDNYSYVAGYFYAGDFYPKGKINNGNYYSNSRDMIYVDTYPGLTQPKQAFATFAHELQHLVNFVTYVQLEEKEGYTDTWVNEGLSAYAEYLYLGEHPEDKCEWLSNIHNQNTIAKGNNFFVWDNYRSNPLAILDDYATVYLFFFWMYLQADTGLQSSMFYDIITSNYPDYRAVIDVAKKINPAWDNWADLLRTWLAANYYPKNTVYGYKGDALEEIIKINPIYVAGNKISLYPGEGVYSKINTPYSVANADNIRYAGLAANATTDVNVSSPYSGTLLTFNANTNNSAGRETGSLTGVSTSITISRTAAENTRSEKWTRPYVIDAQDMLGRDQERLKARLPR